MSDALFWHRLQFAFTISFHYLFPQLTMGLALALVVLRAQELRGSARAGAAADFWTRIFAINFVVGVVTGIPMEFQFGTNWARFSHVTGGVIGQTLAMEGTFAFFLESTFLGVVLHGKDRFGQRTRFAATVALWLGAWLSGYFIIATNAFMQHPVGYAVDAAGRMQVASLRALLFNTWAIAEYAHNMCASVVTSAFVLAGVAAFWRLSGRKAEQVEATLRLGVVLGLAACVLQIFPSGDAQGRLVARHQPAGLAAMEGLFRGGPGADLAVIGQPDVRQRKLENPLVVPGALSFLAYGSFGSTVKGLDDFPPAERPDNVEVLYYAYHVMVGLGTLLLAAMALAAAWLWRGRLLSSRPVLWVLLLATPFPYIATLAGWITAEVGGVVAALELLVGLLLIEIGGTVCEAGQTGLLVTTPWRGRRFLPWPEIRQIRFDASAQEWRLRSSTGDAAAIPAFFTGLAAFAARVLEHAPAEAIDREPGTRARLLGLAGAPI